VNILAYKIGNFFKGHERTVKAKKNIISSFFIKGVSIAIGLVFVPLILDYLDPERYGIWLTLSSVITWFMFFDIGLGNGLRNKLAEAISKNDINLAKTYVSTTYAILAIIFTGVLIIFWIVNPFLNWHSILNTNAVGENELSVIAIIVFTAFIFRFFFQLIGIILLAYQRPAISSSLNLMANILSLIIIFILTRTTKGSLIILATILSLMPVLVLFLASLIFFNREYNYLKPSIKYVDFSKARNLMTLGFKFFYFQLAGVVFITATNFFIAQVSSQEAVAAYNIAYKYLSVALMIYAIVLSPFWSAVTNAYNQNDFIWLKKSIRKLNLLSVGMTIFLLLLFLFSSFVYKIWVGDKITIPNNLTLIITIYLAVQLFVAPFSQFINGFGKLKLGLYVITLKLILYIPTTLFFGKMYGAFGVVLAMTIIQVPSLFFEGTQTYKIINQKAHGIWGK
jgi:O-antigen/teichoic acid export membrane protein